VKEAYDHLKEQRGMWECENWELRL
jgi:hypothetical protein